MNPVFKGWLSAREGGGSIPFALPAAPYEILDSMECMNFGDRKNMSFESTEYEDGVYLSGFRKRKEEGEEVWQLNEFSRRRGELDGWQRTALRGMAEMEKQAFILIPDKL